jgi:hypothetical protein
MWVPVVAFWSPSRGPHGVGAAAGSPPGSDTRRHRLLRLRWPVGDADHPARGNTWPVRRDTSAHGHAAQGGDRMTGCQDQLVALLAAWRADIASEPAPPMPVLHAMLNAAFLGHD